MKHPRARSHFTAARATSGDLLRLALRIIRANPTKNLRSPTGAIVHHSGDAICVMRPPSAVLLRGTGEASTLRNAATEDG